MPAEKRLSPVQRAVLDYMRSGSVVRDFYGVLSFTTPVAGAFASCRPIGVYGCHRATLEALERRGLVRWEPLEGTHNVRRWTAIGPVAEEVRDA